MRNQTPLAPGGPASDVTVYLVLNDFGPLGRAYCQTDEAEANEATVIENLPTNREGCTRVFGADARSGCARGRLSGA
jgi:hypothetical protein